MKQKKIDIIYFILIASIVCLSIVNLHLFSSNISLQSITTTTTTTTSTPSTTRTNQIHTTDDLIPQRSNNERKFTVYMNTFDRDKLLNRCIKHYNQFPHLIDRIIISWNNLNREPPNVEQYNSSIEILFIREKHNSLNNRFKPHHDLIRTDAILNVDDDIIIENEDLEFAFNTWKWFPNQLIGFSKFCRTVSLNNTLEPCRVDGRYHYAASCTTSEEKKKYMNYDPVDYMIALDSAVFFHRKYLRLYTMQLDTNVTNHVTDNRNCEDISLPYLVAIHSKLPSIMIDNYKDLKHMQYENDPGKHVGISRQIKHWNLRTVCLNLYVGYMANGKMPLFRNIFKVSRIRYSDVTLVSEEIRNNIQNNELEDIGSIIMRDKQNTIPLIEEELYRPGFTPEQQAIRSAVKEREDQEELNARKRRQQVKLRMVEDAKTHANRQEEILSRVKLSKEEIDSRKSARLVELIQLREQRRMERKMARDARIKQKL
jgi:hypothetical protein